MYTSKLKQLYQQQLVKAGVPPQKATQAAESLTLEELRLIGEIWLDWGIILLSAHCEASMLENLTQQEVYQY